MDHILLIIIISFYFVGSSGYFPFQFTMSCTCDFCDYREIHELAPILVTKVTEISLSKFPAKMSPGDEEKLVDAVRHVLCLDRPATQVSYKYSRAHVTKLLDDYTKSSHKLVHLFDESADKRKVVMERVFSEEDGLAMAIQLIQRFDSDHAFHCDKPNCGDNMETCQCPFVHVHCVNEGCKLQFSRHAGPAHDAVCPFKLLTCSCGMVMMRSFMNGHLSNDCVDRIVPCPYSGLGCSTFMKFKDVPAHMAEALPDHFNTALVHLNTLAPHEVENATLKQELAAETARLKIWQDKHDLIYRNSWKPFR
jgi:hypothetical protein